jgi:hypothetical protein
MADEQNRHSTSDSPGIAVLAVQLFGLTNFAVAQPLYELLAENAEFFAVRGSHRIDLVLLVLCISFVIPLLPLLFELLIGLAGRRPRRVTHSLLVAVLVAALVLPLLKRLDSFSGTLLLAVAVLVGVAVAALALRRSQLRTYLTYIAGAGLLFPVMFLLKPAIVEFLSSKSLGEQLPSIELTAEAPIIMVVFDAFPVTSLLDEAGNIDAGRYPGFHRLAERSTWYRNATAAGSNTLLAIPAILTGRWPQGEKRVPTYADYPENLLSLLRHSYHLESFEVVTHLGAFDEQHTRQPGFLNRTSSLAKDISVLYLHVLLPESLTGFLPSIKQRWMGFTESELGSSPSNGRVSRQGRVRWFREFLASIQDTQPPTLGFCHAVMPHTPYLYYPSGTAYSRTGKEVSGEGDQWGKWSKDDWAVVQSYQRFLLQVGNVDRLVGELITSLEERDLWDRSLVVITADHGGSFLPADSHRGLTETNYHNIMAIPLFIKAPFQQQGLTADSNVQAVDILPTIADILRVPVPWRMDGQSASSSTFQAPQLQSCFSGRKMRSFAIAELQQRVAAENHRKIKLFGTGNLARLFQIGPAGSIVGKPVTDFEVTVGNEVWASLRQPERFSKVDPESYLVPGEIVGWLGPREKVSQQQPIAVAVNGVIRGTTQTYLNRSLAKTGVWSTLVAESSFRPGENKVEVFLIERGSQGKVTLRAIRRKDEPVSYLGVSLVGGVQLLGIKSRGITKGSMRWTDGTATITVPLAPSDKPKKLRVELADTGPDGATMEILLDGHQLWHGQVPPGAWQQTLDISSIELRHRVTIEIKSDTFDLDRGKGRVSKCGVAIKGIWLLAN